MKCQHHQNWLHHYLCYISNNSFSNLRENRDCSVRVVVRVRTTGRGLCVQSQAGHKTLLLNNRTGCGGQVTFCRVVTHFSLVRRLRMRGTVTPHLHMSLLHGYLLYCKGDRKGKDTVFWKGMTRISFFAHYKIRKIQNMRLLSLACLPVCSSAFKNLKTIERVLENVILDVTRICRKLPVWVKIEQWYWWTLYSYMHVCTRCACNSAVTGLKFTRKETVQRIYLIGRNEKVLCSALLL